MKNVGGNTVRPGWFGNIKGWNNWDNFIFITFLKDKIFNQSVCQKIPVWFWTIIFTFLQNFIRNWRKIIIELIWDWNWLCNGFVAILNTRGVIIVFWLNINNFLNALPYFFEIILIISKVFVVICFFTRTCQMCNFIFEGFKLGIKF